MKGIVVPAAVLAVSVTFACRRLVEVTELPDK
jgi:hypothetical protein